MLFSAFTTAQTSGTGHTHCWRNFVGISIPRKTANWPSPNQPPPPMPDSKNKKRKKKATKKQKEQGGMSYYLINNFTVVVET